MDLLLSHLEPAHLPLPTRGSSARFRLGRMELILEPVRGGFTLLCLDGNAARTWSLGLHGEGQLWVQCKLPRWPLRVALRETLVLVPHSRVRGYVAVPLVPTLQWRTEHAAPATICELLPNALAAEWEDASAAVVQRVTSPFLQRTPLPDEQLRAIVPLFIRNDGDSVQSPDALPLQLREEQLRACRQHLIACPQRLRIGNDGRMHEIPRSANKTSQL